MLKVRCELITSCCASCRLAPMTGFVGCERESSWPISMGQPPWTEFASNQDLPDSRFLRKQPPCRPQVEHLLRRHRQRQRPRLELLDEEIPGSGWWRQREEEHPGRVDLLKGNVDTPGPGANSSTFITFHITVLWTQRRLETNGAFLLLLFL